MVYKLFLSCWPQNAAVLIIVTDSGQTPGFRMNLHTGLPPQHLLSPGIPSQVKHWLQRTFHTGKNQGHYIHINSIKREITNGVLLSSPPWLPDLRQSNGVSWCFGSSAFQSCTAPYVVAFLKIPLHSHPLTYKSRNTVGGGRKQDPHWKPWGPGTPRTLAKC